LYPNTNLQINTYIIEMVFINLSDEYRMI